MCTDFGPDRMRFAGLIPGKVKKSLQYRLSAYKNNNQDNVYGAVIMAEPLREFTRFI